jgi:DNA-directed RNA polymerase specialized sigma24 family protein
MRMVQPLPTSPDARTRVAGRWLEAALPRLTPYARRRAWRRGVVHGQIDDVVSDVVLRIYERVLADAYAEPCDSQESTRRVLDHIDNVIRVHVRSWKRVEAPLRAVGVAADALPDSPWDPADAWAAAELVQDESSLIRALPISDVQRLVVLLHVHPEQVELSDVEAAIARSGRRIRAGAARHVGLTRSVEDTRSLLVSWLPRGTMLADLTGTIGRHGPVRLWLAWILRGPRGSTDPTRWPEAKRERAVNWLDQQLSRGRRALRAALET